MGVSAYSSLIGRRRGWALIRDWALINFFCLSDGRLFEAGANSRLGAYSNKYVKQKVVLVAMLEGKSMPSNKAANTNDTTLWKNQSPIKHLP